MSRSRSAVATSAHLAQIRAADATVRRGVLAVRSWALSQGRAVDVAALTVVVGALVEDQRRERVDPAAWSGARVMEFMWVSGLVWCLDRELVAPPGVAGALRTWWAYLGATSGLADGSDDPADLERALRSWSFECRPVQAARRPPPSTARAHRGAGPAPGPSGGARSQGA